MKSTLLLEPLRELLGDRYAIERELGRGGMGAVFLARDRRLDRPVALKVLPPEFAHDVALKERFARETRLVASFSHPNIVPVFAVEESEDLLAFAMGYVEGESLSARVQRAGPLTTREVVRLLQDVGYALAYAHGRGIVHRDIKPDNIMLERATGRALLMDFGISRTIETRTAAAGLTRVGEVVGTPEFMSPEQATGDVVDGRSDLYSLSLVAFYALTGRLAFSGENTQRVLAQQLTQPVPSVSTYRSDVPEPLLAVIAQCSQKDPAERFATAEALVDALDAAQLAGPEVPTPIRQFAQELGAVSVAMLFGVVVLVLIWEIIDARGWHPMDAIFEQTLVLAIMLARASQTFGQWRHLRTLGFGGTAVRQGLVQVLAEREAMRAELRARPEAVSRRRKVFWSAVAMFFLSYVVQRIARDSRTQIGPTNWSIPPYGIALFFLGNTMLGASLVLLVRSPLRRPIGEWLFRWTWTGPIGERLLRGDTVEPGHTVPPTGAPTRDSATHTTLATGPHIVGSTTGKFVESNRIPDAVPATDTYSIAQLEARIASLEAWRAEHSINRTAS